MKFAHAFTEQLQGNKYPSEWLDAAIRYRQLKKCIKKVQGELAELGLTADMLKLLAREKGAGSEPAATASTCTPGESPSELESNILLKRRGSHDSRISDSSAGSSSVELDEKEWLSKNPAPEPVAREEHPKQTITFSYWFHGPSILSLLSHLCTKQGYLMFHNTEYPSPLFVDAEGGM